MESIEKQLHDVLEQITKEISGSAGISVVDVQSGMALSSVSLQKGFDLDVAAAYNAEVVKQKQKAMDALNLKNQTLVDFVITLTTQIHLIDFITPNFILYFAVDGTTSNLAMIKMVIKKAMPRLKEIVATF
ncbi:MAG: hypothetical protein QM535_00815 [Limnohabitans sp.]|nr:hypothetical protein [Limnohabitans sp.]